MMRKLMIMVGLLATMMIVASCAPPGSTSEGSSEALAGQAVATKKDIRKGDAFILPTTSNQNLRSSVGEILEYQSADDIRKQNPKIRFKIWSSGETYDAALDPQGEANLRFEGKTYKAKMTTPKKDNSPIRVDFDGDGALDVNHKGASLHFKDGSTSVSGRGLWCGELMELLEGETKRWAALEGGPGKDVNLQAIGVVQSETWVIVNVDGQASERLREGQEAVVNDLSVRYIGGLYQDYAGGVHRATLCLPNQ